jgi:hypothetical protein
MHGEAEGWIVLDVGMDREMGQELERGMDGRMD